MRVAPTVSTASTGMLRLYRPKVDLGWYSNNISATWHRFVGHMEKRSLSEGVSFVEPRPGHANSS